MTSRRTVLIADDDARLDGALESVLTGLEYRILVAQRGDAAYTVVCAEPVDAVLLDVHLPDMSGLALYRALLAHRPDLKGRVALMTADPGAAELRTWLASNPCTVFSKPFHAQPLLEWLDATLSRAGHGAPPRASDPKGAPPGDQPA